MSYNIRLDLESDGINRWSNRREQFVGQVRLIQPAILGLQEVVPGQKAASQPFDGTLGVGDSQKVPLDCIRKMVRSIARLEYSPLFRPSSRATPRNA